MIGVYLMLNKQNKTLSASTFYNQLGEARWSPVSRSIREDSMNASNAKRYGAENAETMRISW